MTASRAAAILPFDRCSQHSCAAASRCADIGAAPCSATPESATLAVRISEISSPGVVNNAPSMPPHTACAMALSCGFSNDSACLCASLERCASAAACDWAASALMLATIELLSYTTATRNSGCCRANACIAGRCVVLPLSANATDLL